MGGKKNKKGWRGVRERWKIKLKMKKNRIKNET
jgi:hypothetical protein